MFGFNINYNNYCDACPTTGGPEHLCRDRFSKLENGFELKKKNFLKLSKIWKESRRLDRNWKLHVSDNSVTGRSTLMGQIL